MTRTPTYEIDWMDDELKLKNEAYSRVTGRYHEFDHIFLGPTRDWIALPRNAFRKRIVYAGIKGFAIGFTFMSIIASLIWYLK